MRFNVMPALRRGSDFNVHLTVFSDIFVLSAISRIEMPSSRKVVIFARVWGASSFPREIFAEMGSNGLLDIAWLTLHKG
jgi:hypothetical protein